MQKYHSSEIEYWKAFDLFRIQHPHGLLDYKFPARVYIDFSKPGEYYVVRPYLDDATGQWLLKTATYTEAELDQWQYYRFTGVLDGSDYLTGDEDKMEHVDELILAQSEADARQRVGYPSGGAHWHYGPHLRLYDSFDDHLWIIAMRFETHEMDADLPWMLRRYWEATEAEESEPEPEPEVWREEED